MSARYPKRKVVPLPKPATDASPTPQVKPLDGNGTEVDDGGEPVRTRQKGLKGLKSHRGRDQRLLDMVQMVKLLKRGWSKRDIADYFRVTVMTIENDWKLILTQMKEDRAEEAQSLLEIKLAEYSEIKREAWEAWEQSKRDAVKVTRETYTGSKRGTVRLTSDERVGETAGGFHGHRNGPVELPPGAREGDADLPTITGTRNGEGGSDLVEPPRRKTKVTRSIEGRTGDSSYLKTILTCLEAERVLLALDPKRDVNVNANVVNWDVLAGGIPDGPVPDVVEREIQRAALGYLDTTATPLGEQREEPPTTNEQGIITESSARERGKREAGERGT